MKEFYHQYPPESSLTIQPRPYTNHSVEFKAPYTAQERTAKLKEVGWNVFFFPSEMITGCDLLSDSGTTTMTNEQWAAIHMGDEAYGSNRGYFTLREQIRRTFGEEFFNYETKRPNAFIFHQGRAAEDNLFRLVGRLGSHLIIPSNGHFDTTQANIEANNITALNLFSPDLKSNDPSLHFKGNIDIAELKRRLETSADTIPLVFLTVTNNTGGGQPVSLANIMEASELCHAYNVPLFFDACRFAENAWFIQTYEEGCGGVSIEDIVRTMFSHVDGFTVSFKKDGLSNMGGGVFFREGGVFAEKYPAMSDMMMNQQILTEGHPTYGGLSGRDIMALAKGLETVTRKEYLDYRIRQVQKFGRSMEAKDLPVLTPFGGHAVYLDVGKFFEGTSMTPEGFGGIGLTALLLAAYGHRACELGNFAFGSFDTHSNTHIFPEMNFVRLAVPRLRYEEQDLESVVQSVEALYANRDAIPPVRVTYGIDLPLRHFKARFTFDL